MPIALDHLFGLVPYPTVDKTLIHAGGGTIRAERVPEYVPPPQLVPLAAGQRALEVVVSLIARQGQRDEPTAAIRRRIAAERVLAAGMSGDPIFKHLAQPR